MPAVLGGELVSVVGLCEETAHLLVFLQEAAVLLLELANLDEGRGERGDLVGGEAQGGLEFCDGLFELGARVRGGAGSVDGRTCSM